jgi:hypothetical protein
MANHTDFHSVVQHSDQGPEHYDIWWHLKHHDFPHHFDLNRPFVDLGHHDGGVHSDFNHHDGPIPHDDIVGHFDLSPPAPHVDWSPQPHYDLHNDTGHQDYPHMDAPHYDLHWDWLGHSDASPHYDLFLDQGFGDSGFKDGPFLDGSFADNFDDGGFVDSFVDGSGGSGGGAGEHGGGHFDAQKHWGAQGGFVDGGGVPPYSKLGHGKDPIPQLVTALRTLHTHVARLSEQVAQLQRQLGQPVGGLKRPAAPRRRKQRKE